MKKVQKIWAELGKTAKTPKRGVKLNQADDIKNLVDSLAEAIDDCEYFLDELQTSNYQLQVAMERAEEVMNGSQIPLYDKLVNVAYEMIEKVDRVSQDLGLDPADIFDNYSALDSMTTDLEDAIANIEDEYNTSDFASNGFNLR